MEAEILRKDYEHEKQQERKRKGAHLEAIFEHSVKKSSKEIQETDNKNRMLHTACKGLASTSTQDSFRTTAFENTQKSPGSSANVSGNNLENSVNPYGDDGNLRGNPRCSPANNISPSENSVNPLRKTRNSGESTRNCVAHPNVVPSSIHSHQHENDAKIFTPRELDRESPKRQLGESDTTHYTGLKKLQRSGLEKSSAVHESDSSGFQTPVTIKQEMCDDPVQIMPVQSQLGKDKNSSEDNVEIGEDCLKFLLFSGKLYNCERISDLTHSFSRFVGDNVLGRKGEFNTPSFSRYIQHINANVLMTRTQTISPNKSTLMLALNTIAIRECEKSIF